MEKQKLYPYVLGEAGIPFDQIEAHGRADLKQGYIIGGSGEILFYRTANNFIRIFKGCEGSILRLVSSINSATGVVEFDLHTHMRPIDGPFKTENFTSENRHKDMFAGEFVGFAFEYFCKSGITPTAVRSTWQKGTSDNYDIFMREYSNTGSKAEAAKRTWSGRTFAKYGFSEITDDDIEIITSEDYGEVIQLTFSGSYRPQ